MAAEVGLLAHSNVGVAYELRDKNGHEPEAGLASIRARLFLDLLFPVKAPHPPLTFVLGQSC